MKRAAVLLIPMLAVACGHADREDPLMTPDAGVRSDAGSFQPIEGILVSRVLDGDTLIVTAHSRIKTPDGRTMDGERLRLLGVDAPEIEHPPEPAECWGNEAQTYLSHQVGGRLVTLEYNRTDNLRDIYGRLLVYVSIGGDVVNED